MSVAVCDEGNMHVSDQKSVDMALTTTRGDWLRQFGNPTGWLGSLVGDAMAIKSCERSQWVLSPLDLQTDDRVLEIGFGPGVDIQRVSRREPHRKVRCGNRSFGSDGPAGVA
jgi:hypothetical protein